MSAWLDEHLDELIEQYAAEDSCSPEAWRARAIRYVVMRRYQGSEAWRSVESETTT